MNEFSLYFSDFGKQNDEEEEEEESATQNKIDNFWDDNFKDEYKLTMVQYKLLMEICRNTKSQVLKKCCLKRTVSYAHLTLPTKA